MFLSLSDNPEILPITAWVDGMKVSVDYSEKRRSQSGQRYRNRGFWMNRVLQKQLKCLFIL